MASTTRPFHALVAILFPLLILLLSPFIISKSHAYPIITDVGKSENKVSVYFFILHIRYDKLLVLWCVGNINELYVIMGWGLHRERWKFLAPCLLALSHHKLLISNLNLTYYLLNLFPFYSINELYSWIYNWFIIYIYYSALISTYQMTMTHTWYSLLYPKMQMIV